ncbi:MAG: hypothetical protein GWP10_17365 [Nitrospiraceae bacterium]|nr:hypothetical protein [Nitrospiraceae bacterium]
MTILRGLSEYEVMDLNIIDLSPILVDGSIFSGGLSLPGIALSLELPVPFSVCRMCLAIMSPVVRISLPPGPLTISLIGSICFICGKFLLLPLPTACLLTFWTRAILLIRYCWTWLK